MTARTLVRGQPYRLVTQGTYLQLQRDPVAIRDKWTFGPKATAAWCRFQPATAFDTDEPTDAIRPADIMFLEVKVNDQWQCSSPVKDPNRSINSQWQLITEAWKSPWIWTHPNVRYHNKGRVYLIPTGSDALGAQSDRTTSLTEASTFTLVMLHPGVNLRGTWVFLAANGTWSPNAADASTFQLDSELPPVARIQ